jgi:probable HAF family extracellular repeat protein
MCVCRLAIASRGAAWLVLMGTVMSQARAAPITYNVTDMGQLVATGFDQAGDVVGQYTSSTGFIYTTSGPNAGMVQVLPNASMPATNWPNPGPPPGYTWDYVEGANAAGQAVGDTSPLLSNGGYGDPVGWFYSGGQFTLLPQPKGSSFQILPDSLAINASGQVIFTANDTSGLSHAFLYANGQQTDLGTLPGDTEAQVGGINDQGQIVGISIHDGLNNGWIGRTLNAFLYENDKMYNLNSLIAAGNPTPLLADAIAINNLGQILVVGWGGDHDYLLTPSNLPTVPAPPSWAVNSPEPSPLAFIGLVTAALGCRKAFGGGRRLAGSGR